MSHRHILIICGEPSSDAYGALLAKELSNHATIFSIGGPKIAKESHQTVALNTLKHTVSLNQWHTKIITRRTLKKAIPTVCNSHGITDAIIIDFPGLNGFIANILRSQSIKIHTFVTPNFWLWNDQRAMKTLINYSQTITTIFEKEYEAYNALGATNLYYHGHPLTITTQPTIKKTPPKTLGIFPGSRFGEIESNLPQLCRIIHQVPSIQQNQLSVIICCNEAMLHAPINRILTRHNLHHIPITSTASQCDAALTTPGTGSLLLALRHIPMVIFGRLPWTTYLIATYILRLNVPFIGLPNIVANKTICPEFIDQKTPTKTVVSAIEHVLQSNNLRHRMVAEFEKISTTIQANANYWAAVSTSILQH